MDALPRYAKISLYLAIAIICFHLFWWLIFFVFSEIVFPAMGLESIRALFITDFFHQGMTMLLLFLLPMILQIMITSIAIVCYKKHFYKTTLSLALLPIINFFLAFVRLLI